jgi:hypothetical protein
MDQAITAEQLQAVFGKPLSDIEKGLLDLQLSQISVINEIQDFIGTKFDDLINYQKTISDNFKSISAFVKGETSKKESTKKEEKSTKSETTTEKKDDTKKQSGLESIKLVSASAANIPSSLKVLPVRIVDTLRKGSDDGQDKSAGIFSSAINSITGLFGKSREPAKVQSPFHHDEVNIIIPPETQVVLQNLLFDTLNPFFDRQFTLDTDSAETLDKIYKYLLSRDRMEEKESLWDWIKKNWLLILAGLELAWDALVAAAVVGVGYLVGKVTGAFEFMGLLWDDLKILSKVAWDGVVKAFEITIEFITKSWSKLGELFEGVISKASENWLKLGEKFDAVIDGVKSKWSKLGETTEAIIDSVKSKWVKLGESVESVVESAKGKWTGFSDYIKRLPGEAESGWSKVGKTISGWVESFTSNVWPKVVEGFEGIVATLGEKWSQLIDNTGKIFEGIGTKLTDSFIAAEEKFTKMFSSIETNIANITDIFANAFSAEGKIGKAIEGVSNAFESIMKFITENPLVKAILNNPLFKAVKKLASTEAIVGIEGAKNVYNSVKELSGDKNLSTSQKITAGTAALTGVGLDTAASLAKAVPEVGKLTGLDKPVGEFLEKHISKSILSGFSKAADWTNKNLLLQDDDKGAGDKLRDMTVSLQKTVDEVGGVKSALKDIAIGFGLRQADNIAANDSYQKLQPTIKPVEIKSIPEVPNLQSKNDAKMDELKKAIQEQTGYLRAQTEYQKQTATQAKSFNENLKGFEGTGKTVNLNTINSPTSFISGPASSTSFRSSMLR